MPRLKRRTYARYNEIVKRNRWPDRKVARHFGLSPMSVSARRNRLGLPPVEFPSLTPLKIKRIIRLYKQGKRYDEITKEVGPSRTTINAVLKRYEVPIRPFDRRQDNKKNKR